MNHTLPGDLNDYLGHDLVDSTAYRKVHRETMKMAPWAPIGPIRLIRPIRLECILRFQVLLLGL